VLDVLGADFTIVTFDPFTSLWKLLVATTVPG
jgi:hypothetical protein